MSQLNILVLHRIVQDSIGEWADVRLDTFTKLLGAIAQNQQVITRIDNWQDTGQKQVSLSFDDGHASDYELVLPLLQSHNATATFFIVPDLIGKHGYLSWQQVRQLQEAKMEIGSHSLSHPYLTRLSKEQLLIELQHSKDQIEQNIGVELKSFAYPYGDCSQQTHQVAKSVGFQYICTSKPGLCKPGAQIMHRNSVHSNTNIQDISQILNPDKLVMFKQQFNYAIRHGLKRTLGMDNYIKLKQFIYS